MTMTEPTQPTSGRLVETTTDNFIAPGNGAANRAPDSPEVQVQRLEAFLARSFPSQVDLTNRQAPEPPVDIAIRLLQGYAATSVATNHPRCPEAYCNQPSGHTGEHGVVQYG